MKVTIFVEGGGDSKEQIVRCREGFRKLIEKAGFTRPKSPTITACGGRGRAYDKFKTFAAVSGSGHPILCGKDRTCAKGEKSFKILAELDPATLKNHLLHFRRFIATLDLHL